MNNPQVIRQVGPKPRACGCKGIRSCRLCVTTTDSDRLPVSSTQETVFHYCIHCKRAWSVTDASQQHSVYLFDETAQPPLSSSTTESCSSSAKTNRLCQDSNSGDNSSGNSINGEQGDCTSKYCKVDCDNVMKSACVHKHSSQMVDFEGIVVIENFVTEEEEAFLISSIGSSDFVHSQSGRRKQDYGPKVNFKKQKLRTADFNGLPSYSHFLYERMKTHPHLNDFEPVELCNLEYCQTRGSHIDAHLDDSWLWGERLVTLNLLSDSALTFTLDSKPDLAVRVPLLRRSLIVVSADARYSWKHSILAEDVGERRVAMTFRELSGEFSAGGVHEDEGKELLKLALTFEGCVVSR